MQFLNKLSSIRVTFDGIEIAVKLEQLQKANWPIDDTLFGIFIDANFEQKENE